MSRAELFAWVPDPTGGKGTVRSAETGRFIPRDARGIIDNFDRLARIAQANVVEHVSESILRQKVSTGRLLRVTANSRNRFADQFGFGVGVIDYLDKSEAKYWRTIEEGSEVVWADTPGGRSSMVGMQLRGKFGGSIMGWKATRTPGPQPQPYAGGPFWPKGGSEGGKLRWIWKMPVNPNFVVRNPIRPMGAYARAYREDGVFHGKAARVVNDYLRSVVERELRPRR